MPPIQYQEYIDYLREYEDRSPKTIQNYHDFMKICKMESFDSDNVNEVWKMLLAKLESGASYGAIKGMFFLTVGALKKHGLPVIKDWQYNQLNAKLRKCGSRPDAYSEAEVRDILEKLMPSKYAELLNICILCLYSGLRISACQGLKFTDFEKVDPSIDVYIFKVHSKGKDYLAAISGYAYNWLVQSRKYSNDPNNEYVVRYDQNAKSPFDKLYRLKFVYLLEANRMHDILNDKSPFHSMRHFFFEKISGSRLNSEELGLLMGHAPKTTGYKHYLRDDKDDRDKVFRRKIAEIYSLTLLNSLKLMDKIEDAPTDREHGILAQQAIIT